MATNFAGKAPGVYVFERAGTPPIRGVGTSTAGIIGVSNIDEVSMPDDPTKPAGTKFELADENEPTEIFNFQQFKNSFGNFAEGNQTLAHAVHGFFANGGTRCFVVRVAGIDDIQDALTELERVDDVALVLAPGAESDAQNLIIDHCEKDSVQDRFAILDPQDGAAANGPTIQGDTKVSDYAAMYFPRIEVADQTPRNSNGDFDPEEGRPDPGQTLILPPSGHLAGLYGGVDFNRGVHKAPANETLAGIRKLTYRTTDDEQGPLNDNGINVIRNFKGAMTVWGARTLGDDNGEFTYINVRRLFLFLRKTIDVNTQFAVFEPNTEALRAQITRAVTDFLTTQWRAGALAGSTPDDAFFVQCDDETNPPALVRLGQVNTKIGVAPAFPAEFVVFEISQKTLGAE